jgi:hypothetical protein
MTQQRTPGKTARSLTCPPRSQQGEAMSVVRSLNDVPGDPSKSQQSLTSNQHQPDHHVQEIVVCPLLLHVSPITSSSEPLST